jgi:hypothetical protein
MVKLIGDEEYTKRLREISKMKLSAQETLLAHLAAIEELCKNNNISFNDIFQKAMDLKKKENQEPV